MRYQAFLSYSHTADDKLSPAVQSALHRFAKPWYRRRAMRVFRDQTSLAADPSVWNAIQRALESSEYLLLMASTHAARSIWVDRGVQWWLSNRSANTLLVLLTEGDLVWNAQARDWDWQRTTALPPSLGGRMSDEPLYVDLRWAREEALSLEHTRFRAAILDIAATIRGIPKDELDGEDVRQSRRTRRIAGAAVAAIALAAVVAGWQAVIATQQRTRAEAQALLARSREIAVSSIAARERDPELALLLGIEAGQVAATPEAEAALRLALGASKLRGILGGTGANAEHVTFSPDGRSLAVENWHGTVGVWNVETRRGLNTPAQSGRFACWRPSPAWCMTVPMAIEKTDGMIRHTRLQNESRDYLERREELRRAELDLIRQSEKVAALRRALPQGTPVQDYELLEGPEDLDAGDAARPVRLSDLFSTPTRRPLIIYHFMYGKKQTLPCPMCTMMIDGFNGIASHLAQNVDFAIVAAAGVADLRAHARVRGWRRLRLLSAGESTFKYDLRSENADGGQDSATSVFTLDEDGTVRHTYTNHPWLADDMQERGEDLTIAVYNLLDLTPAGRGDFYARLGYGVDVHWGAYPAAVPRV